MLIFLIGKRILSLIELLKDDGRYRITRSPDNQPIIIIAVIGRSNFRIKIESLLSMILFLGLLM